MKVSIIVPVYNVKIYLENCINSLKNQSYQNIEVILVNDGSTDGSGELVAELIQKDSRFRLVDQENQGLSEARNTGIAYISGDFVFFLDSDDYLDFRCVEKLVAVAKENKGEIVQANFYYNYPSYLLYNSSLITSQVITNKEDLIKELINQDSIKNFAWGKLIRKELLKDISFPKGKYFEDTFWKYKVIDKCSRYIVLGECLLFYTQREQSISSSFSIKNIDQIIGESERLDFILKNYSVEIQKLAKSKFFFTCIEHKYLLNYLSKESERKFYRNTIETYKLKYKLAQDNFWLNVLFTSKLVFNCVKNWNRVLDKLQNKKKWTRIEKTN